MLVIGAPNSSNSLRLVEVAERAGTRARLIRTAEDIDFDWLEGTQILGLTAGASAPEVLVRAVIAALGSRYMVTEEEVRTAQEDHGVQAAARPDGRLRGPMAVYTQVPAETLGTFLDRYDVGSLRAVKGIAEGVENSNYLVDTSGADGSDQGGGARFILTLYEKRVDVSDLPFFIALLDHLARQGCAVPRFIPDRNGTILQELCGRPACLIEFLSGISVTEPTPAQAHSAGAALGQLHKAAQGFAGTREECARPGRLASSWPKRAAPISTRSRLACMTACAPNSRFSMPIGPKRSTDASSMPICSPTMC